MTALLVVLGLLAAAGVAVLGSALRDVADLDRSVGALDREIGAIRAELAARAARADEVAAAQRRAEAAVAAGTTGVRDVHRAVADVPFGLLESLPPTRAAASAVRRAHDRTADGVYEAVAAVNRAAGGLFRALRRPPR